MLFNILILEVKKNNKHRYIIIDKFILQNDSIVCILFYKNELNQQTSVNYMFKIIQIEMWKNGPFIIEITILLIKNMYCSIFV